MKRISTLNRSQNLFGAGKDGFRDGNLLTATEATEFDATWCNAIQEELASIVESVGLPLNPASYTQVLDAIKRMIDAQAGNYALDTGVANAYVVALDPAITAYPNGMTVRVKAVNGNTGASTLDAGAGAVSLVNDTGGGLVTGDVPGGGIFTATYVTSANKFYITGLVPSQAMSQTAADARYAYKAAVAVLKYQLSNGVDGAGTTSGWTAQDLNTTQHDDIGLTLSSGQFTLPAGTYKIEGWATITGAGTSDLKLNIFNATTSTHLIQGASVNSNGSSESPSMIPRVEGVITVVAGQALELYLWGNNTQPQHAVSSGQPEVYAGVTITKL